MRIERMRVRVATMPRLDPTWRTASYAAAAVAACIVEIDAGGLTGIGGLAARPPGKGAPAHELAAEIEGPVAAILVGADALDRAGLLSALRLADISRSVVSAVDVALYDVLAKAAGLPFHALWGGASHRDVPIVRMIGIKPPAELVAAAGELMEEGFTHFKVKLGTGVAEDVERIRALRAEYGARPWIAIDGNGAYTTDDAIALARGLQPFDVRLIEQPIDYADLDGLARLTGASPIPIMADQFVSGLDAALQLCKRRAADMVSIKLGQCGTIDECRQVAEICLASGIRVHVGGSARPAILDAAHAQLAASVPGIESEAEVGEFMALTSDPTAGATIENGCWQLTDAPGFGISILG